MYILGLPLSLPANEFRNRTIFDRVVTENLISSYGLINCSDQHSANVPKDADLASDQESECDSGVDVSTTDVSDGPDDRCHAQTETQRNLDDVDWLQQASWRQREPCARAASDQHQ